VDAGLAEKVAVALEKVRITRKMKGLVLDLRFANGLDYAEAVKLADIFLSEEKPVLDWGTGSGKSTAKENAFKLPTVVLVNSQTRGAPEALAAVLREARVALIIGGKTAGEANLFREFPLDGLRVRIASGKVKLASGEEMPAAGLSPDIAVSVGLDEEKAFLSDPFKTSTSLTPEIASTTGTITNAPRRRINEAELVRLQKEGRSLDDENGATNATPSKTEAAKPIVRDPALARALDLLKGLAIVKPGREK
jgi:C-terminal processing protease CtpA/Prc